MWKPDRFRFNAPQSEPSLTTYMDKEGIEFVYHSFQCSAERAFLNNATQEVCRSRCDTVSMLRRASLP